MKTTRIITIIFICGVVAWFGNEFGPAPQTAEAKVFERLALFTQAMPEYLFDKNLTSEPRKVMVNGNTTWLTVGKTDDSITDVLKFYAGQYPPQPVATVPEELLEAVSDEELKEGLLVIDSFFKNLGSLQHFLLLRDGYGFFGGIECNDKDLKISSKEWYEQIARVNATGNLGEFAVARVVIAMRNQADTKTTVLNIWTDKDFNFNRFKADKFGDMSGRDLDDVPRYFDSRRVLSVEQVNMSTVDSMTLFEGGGTVATNTLFYKARMEDAGWETDKTFEVHSQKTTGQSTLFYVRKDRECTIQISEKGQSDEITTIVVVRDSRNA